MMFYDPAPRAAGPHPPGRGTCVLRGFVARQLCVVKRKRRSQGAALEPEMHFVP